MPDTEEAKRRELVRLLKECPACQTAMYAHSVTAFALEQGEGLTDEQVHIILTSLKEAHKKHVS